MGYLFQGLAAVGLEEGNPLPGKLARVGGHRRQPVLKLHAWTTRFTSRCHLESLVGTSVATRQSAFTGGSTSTCRQMDCCVGFLQSKSYKSGKSIQTAMKAILHGYLELLKQGQGKTAAKNNNLT